MKLSAFAMDDLAWTLLLVHKYFNAVICRIISLPFYSSRCIDPGELIDQFLFRGN